jgi:hypothetical protein
MKFDERTWQYIYDLLMRPWFDRLWIFQEIQLGNLKSAIICGHDKISWPLFRRAIICLSSRNHPTYKPPKKLLIRLDDIYSICIDAAHQPLEEILRFSRTKQCTDPRDKIYGLLSIASQSFRNRISPNYLDTVGDVYKDFFLQYANFVHRLELISHCDTQYRLTDTPTWIPNWSNVEAKLLFVTEAFESRSYSNVVYQSPDTLKCLGIQYATIENVSQSIETEMDLSEILRRVGNKALISEHYITGESLLEAYAWLFSWGYLRERFPEFLKLEDYKDILVKEADVKHDGRGREGVFGRSFLRRTVGRKYLSTKEGHIGFGPASSLPGVSICSFVSM